MEAKPVFNHNCLDFKFVSKKAAQEAEVLLRSQDKNLLYHVHESDLNITISPAHLSKLLSDAVDANIDILSRI